MINLKRINYINGNLRSVNYGVPRIINFFDLTGRNMILFYPNKDIAKETTSLSYHKGINTIEFKSKDHFIELISDSSVMFRVDLIIIDLYKIDIDDVIFYSEMLFNSKLDHIIISNEYKYIINDPQTTVNKLSIDGDVSISDSKFRVESNGDEYTFESYLNAYKRNLTIDEIINKKDDLD